MITEAYVEFFYLDCMSMNAMPRSEPVGLWVNKRMTQSPDSYFLRHSNFNSSNSLNTTQPWHRSSPARPSRPSGPSPRLGASLLP